MAVVAFDPTAFKLAFPAYSTFTDEQLEAYFLVAGLILDNTDASIVSYDPTATPAILERKILLDLLVAHQAELSTRGNGAVGRTDSGTEGSVSFSFDMVTTGSSQWFLQTQWGATFWQATAKYRTVRMYQGLPPRRTVGLNYWR